MGRILEQARCRVDSRNTVLVDDDAVIASNTSSLTITEIAMATQRTERFVGLHFFNPVQRMPLLEVIAAEATEASTMEAGVGYGERLGKTVVETKDKPVVIFGGTPSSAASRTASST